MVPLVVGVAGNYFGTPTTQEKVKAFYEEKSQLRTATEEGKVAVLKKLVFFVIYLSFGLEIRWHQAGITESNGAPLPVLTQI